MRVNQSPNKACWRSAGERGVPQPAGVTRVSPAATARGSEGEVGQPGDTLGTVCCPGRVPWPWQSQEELDAAFVRGGARKATRFAWGMSPVEFRLSCPWAPTPGSLSFPALGRSSAAPGAAWSGGGECWSARGDSGLGWAQVRGPAVREKCHLAHGCTPARVSQRVAQGQSRPRGSCPLLCLLRASTSMPGVQPGGRDRVRGPFFGSSLPHGTSITDCFHAIGINLMLQVKLA